MSRTAEEYFFEAFTGMGRLGPGSEESTRRAAAMTAAMVGHQHQHQRQPTHQRQSHHEALRILDVGCGNGVQTLLLAELFPGAMITAVDNYQPFLDALAEAAARQGQGTGQRLATVCASMGEMDFPDGSFDVIWSEGAIYIIGFERGIREWQRLLAPGGTVVCSEVCWLTDNPAREAVEFWEAEYPQIASIATQLRQIGEAGYTAVDHFVLPRSDWEGYYAAIQGNLDRMSAAYPGDEVAREVIATLQREIDIHRQYGDQYSYAFYLMRR